MINLGSIKSSDDIDKIQNYDEKMIIENFSDDDTVIATILGSLHLILIIVAVVLSFRCNRGFSIIGFLLAICCPWLYIIYALAGVHWNFCPKPHK